MNRFTRLFVLLMLIVLGITFSFGQGEIGGRLKGQVQDTTGAVIQSATVTLTNPATGAVRTTQTDKFGGYIFIDVPPAVYSVKVEAPNFSTANFDKVEINLNSLRSLNVTLKVGSVGDVVTVTDDATSVVSQETKIADLVDTRRLNELPLNTRTFDSLAAYSAGVSRSNGATGQGSGLQASGSRGTQNNFMIDGGDNNDPTLNNGFSSNNFTSGVPLDALQEFTIITANPSAEFGRNSGATVNVVTKSGTNTFHGSLWEYHRNAVTDSRDFYDPLDFKNPFIQNIYGVRVGGPIFKDKTFFSASWEGFRQAQKLNSQFQVPSASYRAAITDPFIRAIANSLPNGSPNPTDTTTELINVSTDNGGHQDSYFLRLDHNFNSRHNLFMTGNLSHSGAALGSQANTGTPGSLAGLGYRSWNSTVNWNWTISNTLVNTARFTFNRNKLGFPVDEPTAAMLAAGTLRTAGPFAGQPFSAAVGDPNGFPEIIWPTAASNAGSNSAFPQGRASNTFNYSDTLSWSKGTHQFKFGYEARSIQENSDFGAVIRPSVFLFDPLVDATAQIAQRFYTGNQTVKYFRTQELGWFVQDSWKVMPRLTIDLGVRYELNLPTKEKNDQISNLFVLNADGSPQPCRKIPLNGDIQNLGIVVPKQWGINTWCTDKNNFAPRVGFAYDVMGNGKTVVRGAYGIFYDRIFGNVLSNLRFSAPFTIVTTSVIPYNGAQATSTVTPTAVLAPITADPGLRTPYTQRWNLSVSRELGRNNAINISYVGANAKKLVRNAQPNFGASFPNEFRPTNRNLVTAIPRTAADISNNVIRAPFGSISTRVSDGYSNHEALEATFTRRMYKGFTITANYTWGHTMDVVSDEIAGGADSNLMPAALNNLLAGLLAPGPVVGGVSTVNPACPAAGVASLTSTLSAARMTAAVRCAEGNAALTTAQAAAIFNQKYISGFDLGQNYGDAAFDVRHRFSATALYELPFGKGKWIGGNAGPVLDRIIGGWQVSSIVENQTGTPAPIFANFDSNYDGTNNDRAVLTGDASALFTEGGNGNVVKHFGPVTSPTSNPVLVTELVCAGTYLNNGTSVATANPCNNPVGQGRGLIDPRGRMGRGFVRSPGIFNMDLGFIKNTKVTERLDVQFRAEMFNVWNHTNFSRPNRNINQSAFGQITSQRFLNGTRGREMQFALKLIF